jgi:hypothetical protein
LAQLRLHPAHVLFAKAMQRRDGACLKKVGHVVNYVAR